MTEWLINYSGGFVRRGLPVTLVGMLVDATGLRANLIVVIASLACYLALAVWLLRHTTAYFPPALILSCVVMGIPAYQDSIVRKDCLGLLFFLACVSLGGWRGPKLLVIGGLNLIAAAAILSHETFAFYGLAAYVFLRDPAGREPWLAQVAGRAATLIPAGLCFLLTVIYHGTPAHAVAVNNSWRPLWDTIDPANPGHGEPAAAIAALGWTTAEGLSLSLYMLTSGFYQPLAWAMVFLISFLLLVLSAGRGSDQQAQEQIRIRFVAILLCQLAFISPLFHSRGRLREMAVPLGGEFDDPAYRRTPGSGFRQSDRRQVFHPPPHRRSDGSDPGERVVSAGFWSPGLLESA